jgi:hypothetical protein
MAARSVQFARGLRPRNLFLLQEIFGAYVELGLFRIETIAPAIFVASGVCHNTSKGEKKLRGLSPRANYIDRATAACRRNDCQLFVDRGCHVVSVTDTYGRILGFLDRSRYFSIK